MGGIGIMSMMMANIFKWKHEIRVRRAVGARKHDIWKQFLFEALTISLFGGVIGILFGFEVSRPVGKRFGALWLRTVLSQCHSAFQRLSDLSPVCTLRSGQRA